MAKGRVSDKESPTVAAATSGWGRCSEPRARRTWWAVEAGAPGCSRDKEGRVMRLEMGRRAATDVDRKG